MSTRRTSALDVSGGIAGVALFLVAGAVIAAWRASQRAETDLNARTWARLLPTKDRDDNLAEKAD